MPIDQMLAILAGTPCRIAGATTARSPEQVRARPAADGWSVNDVLAHLRACADQWGDSIVTMLDQDHPTLRAINPRNWIKQTSYPDLAFDASFHAYCAQRDALLALLNRLTPDDWARTATFTGAGAPLQRTVRGFGERLARHERPHVKQIEAIVAEIRRNA